VADMGIIPAGSGHMLTARGSVMAFKAVAAQTGGDFSLMERTLPPGGRKPPAHRHVNCSEAFSSWMGRSPSPWTEPTCPEARATSC
jgi:hypothetical protein